MVLQVMLTTLVEEIMQLTATETQFQVLPMVSEEHTMLFMELRTESVGMET